MSTDFDSNSDSNDSQKTSKYPPERLRGLIRFEKGNRANPGGLPKGTPRIDVIYARLLAMSTEEIANFQPSNGAEILAFKQFKEGCINKKSLGYAQEITNRTDGPIIKKIEIETNSQELERIIIRVQERILAQTGIEITREQAMERIAHYRPDLVSS